MNNLLFVANGKAGRFTFEKNVRRMAGGKYRGKGICRGQGVRVSECKNAGISLFDNEIAVYGR